MGQKLTFRPPSHVPIVGTNDAEAMTSSTREEQDLRFRIMGSYNSVQATTGSRALKIRKRQAAQPSQD